MSEQMNRETRRVSVFARGFAGLVGIAGAAGLVATATPAMAGGGGEPATATFIVESTGALPGELARVTVEIDATDRIGFIDFTTLTDGNLVDDVLYTSPIFLTSWAGFDTAPGIDINVSAACTFAQDQIVGRLPLVDLLIEVPADAIPGSTIAVDLTNLAASNYEFQSFEVFMVGGEIVVGGTECEADVDGSGAVDFADVVGIISAWGPCVGCAADIDADDMVGLSDLLGVLASFGPCIG